VCRNARGGRPQGQGTIGHLVRHNTAVSLSALHIICLVSFCDFFIFSTFENDFFIFFQVEFFHPVWFF
jgi:hypothetical protein